LKRQVFETTGFSPYELLLLFAWPTRPPGADAGGRGGAVDGGGSETDGKTTNKTTNNTFARVYVQYKIH